MTRKGTTQTRRRGRHGYRRLTLTVGSDWAVAVIAHAIATLVLLVAAELLHLPTCGR